MFGRKSVKQDDHRKPRRVNNRKRDRRQFSDTASSIDMVNVGNSGRPVRGGIRL